MNSRRVYTPGIVDRLLSGMRGYPVIKIEVATTIQSIIYHIRPSFRRYQSIHTSAERQAGAEGHYSSPEKRVKRKQTYLKEEIATP